MLNVGNSLFPNWDAVSQAKNCSDRSSKVPIEKIKPGFFGETVGRANNAVFNAGCSLLNRAGKILGKKCLKTSMLMSPILRRLNLMKPYLESNEEHLFKVIADYDQLELANEALKSFKRHKRNKPDADFASLKGYVFEELRPEKASQLHAAARRVTTPGLPEGLFWETFFVRMSDQILSENATKQEMILRKEFKPISDKVLPNWLPFKFFHNGPVTILNWYRDLKKAPLREANLVSKLNELLYKGLSTKDEGILPTGKEGDAVRQSNEYKKYLYKEARVDGAADFINNFLSVLASGLSLILEDIIHADKDAFGELLDFTSEHIKIALLKFLNSLADQNIDDIRAYPNGKNSKALLGHILLNIAKLWDNHKEKFLLQMVELNKLNQNDRLKKINHKIFNDFSKDLLDMVRVNPLDDIDVLSEKLKTEYWEKVVQYDIVPEFLAELYVSLTQWETERKDHEISLTSFSGYAVDAMRVVSRRIVESAQNYFAHPPNAFSDNLRKVLKRKFESDKTVCGNAAANYLGHKENFLSFKSVIDASLPVLAKVESVWKNLEEAVQPAIAKIANALFIKIDMIEKNEGNRFFRDTSLKLFKLFTKHYDIVHSIQVNAGKEDAAKLSKSQMVAGMRGYNLCDSKNGNIEQKRKYFDAKVRVFKAKENFDKLNNTHVRIAYLFDITKKWFHIGEEFLERKTGTAFNNVENARKELELAEEILVEENSKLRAKEMGKKILQLLNLNSAADLPLPENLGSLREDIWESLVDVGMPSMLQTAVDNMTDKDMMNTILTKFLQTVKDPVKDLKPKDPEIENVRTMLEAIAFNSAQYKEASEIAMKILDASEGLTLEKGISKIITTNPRAKRMLKVPIEKCCEKLPNVYKKWIKLISPSALQAEIDIQDFHKSHKEFDSECGVLLKRLLKFIPLQLLHHVNILNVSIIEDSAAEKVGKTVRESIEPWTFKKMIDLSLASMAESQMPQGKWDVEHAKNISSFEDNQGIKRHFIKPAKVQNAGYTRDFGLPTTPEAKRSWDLKQAAEIHNRDVAVRKEMTEFLNYQFKGILASWFSTAWHSFLRIIHKAIQFGLETNAPRLRDFLNKHIFYVATLIKSLTKIIVEKLGFLLDPPLTFLINLYVRSKANKIVGWMHMSHVHDELVWDMMETIIDQTHESARKLNTFSPI
ncbi:MAG: hypothetical protein H0U49_06925 [Parachlamydiaceae bacterium]|nr:hypothetical protein [Parachlamydiaceae bacterium]